MDVEFQVLEYSRGQTLPKDYSLTTLAQAQAQPERVKEACASAGLMETQEVRLQNGLLRFRVTKGQELITKEDCLIALAYAAEHDDVDDEVEELVECAGKDILRTRMPFAFLGTILHVCTNWASINTLEKVLKLYPASVDVYIVDRDEDTALHNLPNDRVPKSYDDCKRAACLLLGLGGVNANELLSKQNNYGRLTAVCKALRRGEVDVCRALLDAGREMEEKEKPAISEVTKDDPHWLTLKAYDRWNTDALYTALHLAVLGGYDDIVNKILVYPRAKLLNLTSLQDHKGNTPLHIAAKVGHPEICSMLLKYSMEINKDGGNVRSQNNAGKTPLHIASTRGHTEVCKKLLEYGASMDLPDKHGKYPLTNAFTRSHKKVVETLLDACLPRDQDAPTPAKSELSAMNTKSKHSLINERFEFGFTPLHVAVAISSCHHIRNLLKAGAWVDSRSSDGRTPLHVATQQNDPTALITLLEEKEALNVKVWQGWINMRDSSGQTALHNVVRLSSPFAKDQSESSEEKSGAKDQSENSEEESGESSEEEISADDGESDTDVICWEEISADELDTDDICKLVKALLKKGAWVDVQDCDGETALHVAAQRHEKVVCTLLSESKDHNYCRAGNQDKWIAMCDFSGETALHEAVRTRSLDIVERLLNTTKSPDDLLRVRDMENMTAFDWAAQQQNVAMIDLMMKGLETTDITKEFLMWNLKEHINPRHHMYLCYKYGVKGNQTSLLQAAVREREVDIARELINRGADVLSLEHKFGKKSF